MTQENKPRLKKIKSSIFERTLSLTKFTVSAGTKVLGHNLSTFFDDTDLKSEKWKSLLTDSALHLSKELGELKGSLMKAGQMISMYGELFLPKEANEFLKTLQSQSPPIEFSIIEKIIKEDLGAKADGLLIDENPIGSASLGQVHRARIKDSPKTTLALKVQYPGVEAAIKSDLKSLRTLLSMLKLLPSDFQTNVLFEEIETMLRQELDYPLEREQTRLYGSQLQEDQRYIVPRIFDEWSGKKVIASSFEMGVSADHPMVQSLPQDRRNQLAESFLDLYFRELFQWGLVQTDPHLGNYKVLLRESNPLKTDQLVLLDFGAVRKYPEEFLKPYRKMVKAAIERNLPLLEEASLELQFIQADDPPALKKYFVDFCFMTVEPFLPAGISQSPFMSPDGVYDWKNSDLPKRLTQIGLNIIKEFPLRTPPREIVFLDRKTGGVFIFMSVLGAKIRGSEVIEKYIR
jgi:predicted unusual protein kinase regulating ubiquinone biosynthesis (AarF/ABC1/UbiB family)